MSTPRIAINSRTQSSPFSPRVEAAGVKAYTIYNHTLLAASFRSIEDDYRHLKEHVQLWDVSCERQVEIQGTDAARLMQMMTPIRLLRALRQERLDSMIHRVQSVQCRLLPYCKSGYICAVPRYRPSGSKS